MKRETKLRGLENKLRSLVPTIMEIRDEVAYHRDHINWLNIYYPIKGHVDPEQKKQLRRQAVLDRVMDKYHKINAERRKLRIIQKSKQLSIL